MPSHESAPIEQSSYSDTRFTIIDSRERLEQAREIVEEILPLGEVAEDFKAVDRKPRLASGRHENDAEHSWHLGIMATSLAARFYPHLNIEMIWRFSAVHDLSEIGGGDISSFGLNEAQMAEKEKLDQEGTERILRRIRGIVNADLREYERQDTPESRFVRATDKLLPIIVTLTSGNMEALKDYGVDSLEKFREQYDVMHARIQGRFGDEFPEIVAAHAVLCTLLEDEYVRLSDNSEANEAKRSSIEFEYKYLVDLDQVPEWVTLHPDHKREELRQGYAGIGSDGSEARIRSYDNERFDLTVKQPGTIERKEDIVRISEELFEDLWIKCEGQRIEKVRYTIPYGQWKIELDIYEDGSAVVEVEFNKDDRIADARLHASTFEPPEWFGKNVSGDERYKTQNISRFGIPTASI